MTQRFLAFAVVFTLAGAAAAAPPTTAIAPDDAQRGAQHHGHGHGHGGHGGGHGGHGHHGGGRHHRGNEAPSEPGLTDLAPMPGQSPPRMVPQPHDARDPLMPMPF